MGPMIITPTQDKAHIVCLSHPQFLQPHPRSSTQTVDPDAILTKIFSFLSVKDACRCSQVCHEWKRIADSDAIWKRHIGFTLRSALIPHYDGQTYKEIIVEGMMPSSKLVEKYQTFLDARYPSNTYFVVVNLAKRYGHIVGVPIEKKIEDGFKRKIVYIYDEELRPSQINRMLVDIFPKGDEVRTQHRNGQSFFNRWVGCCTACN